MILSTPACAEARCPPLLGGSRPACRLNGAGRAGSGWTFSLCLCVAPTAAEHRTVCVCQCLDGTSTTTASAFGSGGNVSSPRHLGRRQNQSSPPNERAVPALGSQDKPGSVRAEGVDPLDASSRPSLRLRGSRSIVTARWSSCVCHGDSTGQASAFPRRPRSPRPPRPDDRPLCRVVRPRPAKALVVPVPRDCRRRVRNHRDVVRALEFPASPSTFKPRLALLSRRAPSGRNTLLHI